MPNYYIARQRADKSRTYLDTSWRFHPELYQNDTAKTQEFTDLSYALMIAGELDAIVLTEGVGCLVPV